MAKYVFCEIPADSVPPTGGIFRIRPVTKEEKKCAPEMEWNTTFRFAPDSDDEYYMSRTIVAGGPLRVEFEAWRCVGYGRPCEECEHRQDCPEVSQDISHL